MVEIWKSKKHEKVHACVKASISNTTPVFNTYCNQLSNLESMPFATCPSLSPCSYVVRSCNMTLKGRVTWPEVTRNVGHWHWHFFDFTMWPLEVFQRKAWRCLVTMPWIGARGKRGDKYVDIHVILANRARFMTYESTHLKYQFKFVV